MKFTETLDASKIKPIGPAELAALYENDFSESKLVVVGWRGYAFHDNNAYVEVIVYLGENTWFIADDVEKFNSLPEDIQRDHHDRLGEFPHPGLRMTELFDQYYGSGFQPSDFEPVEPADMIKEDVEAEEAAYKLLKEQGESDPVVIIVLN